MNSFVKLGIVVATANLLAVAGFAGWLAATGRIDRERIDRVRELFAKPVADEAKEKQDALSQADEAALAEDAMRWRGLHDEAVAEDDQATAYVRMLEPDHDRRMEAAMPSGDDLAAELEKFLREQRDDTDGE